MVLDGSRTMILHNNQPKMCRHDGGGIIRDALPDGEVRGARSDQFRGDRVERRPKNRIKSMSVLINFFLNQFTSFNKIAQLSPRTVYHEEDAARGWLKNGIATP